MKLYTRVFNELEGMEPFEVQDIKEGVSMELYYMNDTKFLDEFTHKGNFAVFSTKDGTVYRLLIEKGYYEVMNELYDVETNRIWEEFWCDVNKCRKNYMLKILMPVMLVYLILTYIIIALTDANMFAFIACVFGLFLVNGVLGSKNKTKMQNINYEAGNKIKKAKGASHFEELSKAQELYYAKFFGYEEELEKKQEENNDSEKIENPDYDDEIERKVLGDNSDLQEEIMDAEIEEEKEVK